MSYLGELLREAVSERAARSREHEEVPNTASRLHSGQEADLRDNPRFYDQTGRAPSWLFFTWNAGAWGG